MVVEVEDGSMEAKVRRIENFDKPNIFRYKKKKIIKNNKNNFFNKLDITSLKYLLPLCLGLLGYPNCLEGTKLFQEIFSF